ncbi:unnamed protein product [Paramecium sonneborni]|uniref:Uncharacterized protein n=1 Tax=Paramecium sonneborni TaxID=65129 RepID=A0A8S1R0T8_9CILI|nr:unnamed protein product [Paramecium sonneborni]
MHLSNYLQTLQKKLFQSLDTNKKKVEIENKEFIQIQSCAIIKDLFNSQQGDSIGYVFYLNMQIIITQSDKDHIGCQKLIVSKKNNFFFQFYKKFNILFQQELFYNKGQKFCFHYEKQFIYFFSNKYFTISLIQQLVYQSDFLIYFSNKENTLIKVEILNSSHKFGKSLILFKTVKPISIKIIQNEKLFLGYSNGQIKQYSLKSNQLINNYQIKQENSIQMIFSSIIFRKQFCLGIIQNRILKLNYLSKQTENFLNATQNISQFSYYYDSQENIYIIHALLENNKIYKSKMINGKEIDGKYYLFKQNSLVYIWLPKWLHKWILNQVNLNNNYLYINNQKCQNQLHQYQSFFLFQNA